MSLLIDALKKHRQDPMSTTQQSVQNPFIPESMGKKRKIILIALIALIVIAATATVSFLLFKHIEKKRMISTLQAKVEKIDQIKSLLGKNSDNSSASLSEGGQDNLRAKLQEKLEQKNGDESSNPSAEATAGAASNISDANVSTSDSSALTNSMPAMQKPGQDAEYHQEGLRSHVKKPALASSQQDSQLDNASVDTSANDGAESDLHDPVNIQLVSDQVGANNPTYQKALNFVQNNQYDQALSLLENNNDVLLKTQGLSALLLARIYLSIGEYVLANDAIDRAVMLHLGSEVDLMALKAQALFMQHKYQETIDVLSSQSPDLSVSPEYYALLADAYIHINQAQDAASIFEQIVARFPDSANYWLGLAVAYQKSGDVSSASVAYHRAAQLSADNPQVMLFINQQINLLKVR